MADNGERTTDLAAQPILDDVLGNRDGTTARSTVEAFANQLLAGVPFTTALAALPQEARVAAIEASVDGVGGRVTTLEQQAFDAAPYYADTTAGLAATVVGAQFRVKSTDAHVAYRVYTHSASNTADLLVEVPSDSVLGEKVAQTEYDAKVAELQAAADAAALDAHSQKRLLATLWDSLTAQDITPGFVRPDVLVALLGSAGVPALFDFATSGSGYYLLDGQEYSTATAILNAVAGVNAGGLVSLDTPWVAPTRFSGISNQQFDADVSGWETYGHAAVTRAWDPGNGGQLLAYVDPAAAQSRPAFSQKVLPDDGSLAGKCLAFTATAARNGTTNSITINGTTYNQAFSSGVSSSNISSTALTTPARQFLNLGYGTGAYIGSLLTSAPSSGGWLVTEFDVREARPFEAFPNGLWDCYLEDQTPAELADDRELMFGAADNAKTRDRFSVVIRSSDRHVIFTGYSNASAQFSIDLGEAVLGAVNRIALRMKVNSFAGALNGASPVFDSSGAPVGVSRIRWNAGLRRIALWETEGVNSWLSSITGGAAAPLIWTEGDSMMNGAYGVYLWQKIQAATGISVIDKSAGGNTWAQITDRSLATMADDPTFKGYTYVVNDGSANGFTTVQDVIDRLRAVVDAKGDENWMYIPPLTGIRSDRTVITEPSDYVLSMKAIRDAVAGEFGEHHVYMTIWEDLQALADGSVEDANDVASGVIPGSLFVSGGSPHLGNVANDEIAAKVAPLILTLRSQVGIA